LRVKNTDVEMSCENYDYMSMEPIQKCESRESSFKTRAKFVTPELRRRGAERTRTTSQTTR